MSKKFLLIVFAGILFCGGAQARTFALNFEATDPRFIQIYAALPDGTETFMAIPRDDDTIKFSFFDFFPQSNFHFEFRAIKSKIIEDLLLSDIVNSIKLDIVKMNSSFIPFPRELDDSGGRQFGQLSFDSSGNRHFEFTFIRDAVASTEFFTLSFSLTPEDLAGPGIGGDLSAIPTVERSLGRLTYLYVEDTGEAFAYIKEGDISVVPLPPAALLLAGSLFGFAWFRTRIFHARRARPPALARS